MTEPVTFRSITCAELMTMKFPPIAPLPDRAPTWVELIQVEPRLVEVEAMALRLHPRASQDDWPRAWSDVKAAFMPLVGWEAEQYGLRHSAAYDVAYDHLLNAFETGKT